MSAERRRPRGTGPHEHRCRACGKVYPCWGRKRARCPGAAEPIGPACRTCRDAGVLRPLTLEQNLDALEFLSRFDA